MPTGTYLHLDEGVEESFQCAPGPAGWRYVSHRTDGVRLDVTVDSRWRQIRLELATAHWLIRGGAAGHDLLWVRQAPGSGEATEHTERAAAFLSESPGLLVATARYLALDPGATADVRLVRLTLPALSPLAVEQRWHLAGIVTHDSETVPLPVERYEITDRATAEPYELHLAGDVVLEAPGIELTALESPPTLAR